jgi:iron(III) transport system ATP-binding protein
MSGVGISLRSVTRSLGGRAVLGGVTLEVRPGEWLALLGPSGSGKTTLLRLISGLDRPDGGEVLLDGRSVSSVPPRDRRIGMVFQDLALWPYLTVEEHVREASHGDGRATIERFGLGGFEHKRPHELSGGERQRLALARALAGWPQLLLLDEPFSNLDPLLRRVLAETVAELHRAEGMTTVCVSHHFDAPVRRANRVVLLREGKVEQVGGLLELRAVPRNEWVAAFLSEDAE